MIKVCCPTVFTLRAGQRAAADAYVKACQDFDDDLEKMTAQVSHDPPVTLSKDEVDSYVASKVVTFFQVRVHGMAENENASIIVFCHLPILSASASMLESLLRMMKMTGEDACCKYFNIEDIVLQNDECIEYSCI
jgi:hypothetical protein